MKIKLIDNLDIRVARIHFEGLMDQQEKLIKNHQDLERNTEFLQRLSSFMDEKYSSDKYYLLEDKELEYNLVVKRPRNTRVCGNLICPRFVDSYELKHLYSSIITHIILNDEKDITTIVRSSVYLLYYYWFFKGKNIQQITNNVCADLEAIIELMLRRQYTTYKEKDVATPTDYLSMKLRSERLVSSSKTPSTVNLRR